MFLMQRGNAQNWKASGQVHIEYTEEMDVYCICEVRLRDKPHHQVTAPTCKGTVDVAFEWHKGDEVIINRKIVPDTNNTLWKERSEAIRMSFHFTMSLSLSCIGVRASGARSCSSLKPCPHCRRKVRLSPKTATVAENGDSRTLLRVSLFCDSVDRA